MRNADILMTNALVLTMDDKLQQFDPGAVAIIGDSILAVGPDLEIQNEFSSNQIFDCHGQILMPGLVNTHTHAPMTLLRGLADDLRLDVWLMGYMMPVERKFVTPEFVYLGTQLACAEMIRSGITSFADMYYFEDSVAQAASDAGMRALCGQTVLKFPSPDAQSYEESFTLAREFIKKWKGHPLITPSIAPHAPYTCTEEILQSAASLAIEFNIPLQIHLSETAAEVNNMRQQYGMPVIPFVKKQNLLEAKVLAAHCIHVDEGEIRTLEHAHAGVAHNPTSNLKLASGIAPVKRMLELGLSVGIGTDGPASNNDLDMFEELRLSALIAKNSTGDPTALPAQTVLLMGTRYGAKAMHMGEITGSLEVGKRADMIIVNNKAVHNSPRFRRDKNSPYAQIIYSSKATDVIDVMINGKWVMSDRKLLTLDEYDLLAKSEEYAQQIDNFLILRENSVLSKLIAIGGATEEESFEVQVKIPIDQIEMFLQAIQQPEVKIIRQRHYREYDTYLNFDDPEQGRLRFREDHFIDINGQVNNVRTRLTHIGMANEFRFPEGVVLSRSRYLAPAAQSLRFYREYFKPDGEVEVEKDRRRFLVSYHGTEFYVNLDTVTRPDLGKFLEVKSRTWSRKDADQKSKLVSQLIEYLGASIQSATIEDYIGIMEGR